MDLAAMLEGRKVDLRSLTDSIDTKGAAGRFFFNVMAGLVAAERELILERTMAGLAAAKRAGKIGGRKPSMTPAKLDAACKLLDAGQPPKDVASAVGVSVATLYRHCPASEREGKHENKQIHRCNLHRPGVVWRRCQLGQRRH
ncbi:recombinase family protein [Verminephrobacter eiseniae]|uniref:recombinase family protein n=1 Tax=Verminephrobacter eiseniae TaxID=364317 RepID=UPI0022377E52|nr:recombinase family protein [Verminephrobacter eiseniae]